MNRWFSAVVLLVCGAACSAAQPKAPPAAPARAPAPKASAAPAASWRTRVPTPGPRGEFVYPAPETAELASGMRVFVARRPGSVVSTSLVVRHEAAWVPAGKSGVAALTARMMTEATRKRSHLELAEAAESLGSNLVHEVNRDFSVLELSTLRADLERGLALLAEVVQEPDFKPNDFERVRAEWLDGLIAERQNPAQLAALAGLRLLLGPEQGAPMSGSVSDVKRLTPADLRSYYARAYVPSNAALVVVGDVTLNDVRAHLDQAFGAWRPKSQPATPAQITPKASDKLRLVLVDRPGAVQTAIFTAQPFPARNAPEFEVRQVLSKVLGGLFTSRINHNLREVHAYTYGARSQAIATRQWGAFVVTTSVKTENTADALRELLGELNAIQGPSPSKPLNREELERAKADLANSLGAHLEHVSHVASDMHGLFAHALPLDYYTRYPSVINAIAAAQVSAEANTRLTPDRLLVVVVGDAKQIEAPLRERFGIVERALPELTD